MNAKSKLYILIVTLLVILVVVLDSNIPKQVNWNERYDINGTMPFDLKIFYNEMKSYKKWNSFEKVDSTFYQFSEAKYADSFPTHHLVMYIGNEFSVDEESEKKLLKFVENGNDLFISVNSIERYNLDTIGMNFVKNYLLQRKMLHINLYNTDEVDSFPMNSSYTHISDDNSNFDYYILGYVMTEAQNPQLNFIKVEYGKGNIYLHSNPFVFSNYFLLYVSQSMTETIFSSLDNTDVIFLTENRFHQVTDTHLLKFIFQNKTLKWAWYISLAALVFFILFQAKRRQRIIPIIKPLENTTIAFTQTISNLFYETKDHDFIAEKRIIYFLDHVRNRYQLDTSNLNKEFIESLSVKSNVSLETTELVIEFINKFKQFKNIPENQLIYLDRLLEKFKSEEQSLNQN